MSGVKRMGPCARCGRLDHEGESGGWQCYRDDLQRAKARIEKLEAALREAMEWNWFERGTIPTGVLKQMDEALSDD